MAGVNPVGGSGDAVRDSACTPKWLADIIGPVDLDPASNLRSFIEAEHTCRLETGGDGLLEGHGPGHFMVGPHGLHCDLEEDCCSCAIHLATSDWTVFCNPPYSRGQVRRWVSHYKHTRFIFLLRWDPSTAWFSEILPRTTHVWFPARRINFDPPPGVKFSSNPYPHALYLRYPSASLLSRLDATGYLFTR